MAKEDYDLLKAEIPSIADSVKLFPEELQERVFLLLVNTLLNHPLPPLSGEPVTIKDEEIVAPPPNPEPRNYVEEFKKFFNEKVPNGKMAALEFATLVAYFFKNLAPIDHQLKEITKETLEEAYRYVPLRPGDLQSALSNAKKTRGFLELGEATGAYKLAPAGSYFVEHELPKKSK